MCVRRLAAKASFLRLARVFLMNFGRLRPAAAGTWGARPNGLRETRRRVGAGASVECRALEGAQTVLRQDGRSPRLRARRLRAVGRRAESGPCRVDWVNTDEHAADGEEACPDLLFRPLNRARLAARPISLRAEKMRWKRVALGRRGAAFASPRQTIAMRPRRDGNRAIVGGSMAPLSLDGSMDAMFGRGLTGTSPATPCPFCAPQQM